MLDEQALVEDDRVKSIQRKVFLKTHRFELLPTIFVSVNDPYYSKWGGAVRGAFFLADTLAVAAHVSIYELLPTDDVRTAKANFQSRIFYSCRSGRPGRRGVEPDLRQGRHLQHHPPLRRLHPRRAGVCGPTPPRRRSIQNPGGPAGRTSPPSSGMGLRFMTTDCLSVNLR